VTFAKRLVLGSVLILVLTVAILLSVAERSLRNDLEAEIGRTLASEGRLARKVLPADAGAWQSVVRDLSVQSGHRITLIDRSGRVRADSDFPQGPPLDLENHAGRPEVRTALAGGVGMARRRSASVGRPFLYVAIPGGPGAVRVAADLDQVDEIVGRAQGAVAGAALLALVVGTLLALTAGRSVAQPLVSLGAAARDIAAGAPPRFPRSGIPEIDSLVTALRQMHQQLNDRFDEVRREQAETSALVESMVEGVIAADERGHIVTANPAARRLLGYDPTQPLPDFAELFRIKAAREVVNAVLLGQAIQDRELEYQGRSVLMNARPLPSGGAVLVMHDLTDLRRLEVVRRDFVANVSHELKTPLTSISGYAETLLSDGTDLDTTRKFLNIILDNSRRMQRLVDDLLDLARIESGRWQPEREPVDVAAAAQETWNELADRAAARKVDFAVEVGDGAGLVLADGDALHQILTNLFDNSLRYTGPGGRIVCRSRSESGGIAVSVSDNGSGIIHEHLPRIFERFYRADPSRSREEGGTGLGLAIVKHLVEAHGGSVQAVSERGDGTTVTCWFPGSAGSRMPATPSQTSR
jgi:PAS domain S-box-containing protein